MVHIHSIRTAVRAAKNATIMPMVLDFFVWEGPLIHSKKIMTVFGNMPVNPPQKWRSRPRFGGVTARAVPQTTAVPTLIRGVFAL